MYNAKTIKAAKIFIVLEDKEIQKKTYHFMGFVRIIMIATSGKIIFFFQNERGWLEARNKGSLHSKVTSSVSSERPNMRW